MTDTHKRFEEWEKIKEVLSECDEREFATHRDKLFADVDRLLSQTLLSERERIKKEIENIAIEKAHTYSSENADIYPAYENGQEYMKKMIVALLQALDKEL